MLDDDLEDDAAFRELESNVLTRGGYLAQLRHGVQPLLGGNHDSPLAPILLLQELDQHICRVVREAFSPDRCDDIVLAKVFEVLIGVLGALDPKWVVLGGLALLRNLPVQQIEAPLHRDQVLNEALGGAVVAQAVVALVGGELGHIVEALVDGEVARLAV